MKVELRADAAYISGYVNVTGRESRPVFTPKHGKVIEIIERRAFEKSLARNNDVIMTLDHNNSRELASMKGGTLKLKEDEIGLRAEAVITDDEVIKGAKAGKIKGWSFRMQNIIDAVEERAEGLPIRRISDMIMTEVTLAMNKIPVYAATSVELRADDEIETEERSFLGEIELVQKEKPDYAEFKDRVKKLETR